MVMQLYELPILMECFHQIQADKGYSPGRQRTWYIDRYGIVPDHWQQEFMRCEQLLGRLSGLTLSALFSEDENPPSWYGGIEGPPGDMALTMIWGGVNDSTEEVLAKVCGIHPDIHQDADLKVAAEVLDLLNDFFDGAEGSRHDELQKLFITKEYQI
jgi:hypothetical protein